MQFQILEAAMQSRDPPQPLVSVVIPTFNRQDYLRIALASALAQSLRDFEIVVQDNASAGDPEALVESFADPRVRYFRNPTTVSQTQNVISACAKARGKYIAVLCDDDVWHVDFLRQMLAPLEANDDVVLAFCDHDIIDGDGRRDDRLTERVTRSFHRHRLQPGIHRPFDEIATVYRSICTLSAAVLRRDAIDWRAVPPDMPLGLDLYLAYLAARTGKACHYLPTRLAQMRYHPGSLTSGLKRSQRRLANARNALLCWRAFFQDGALRRNRRYFELKAGLNALVIVTALLRCGDWRGSFRELRRFWAEGLIRPRILLYHLAYAKKLGRMRA